MALSADIQARLDKVVAAFEADGFRVQSFPDPLAPGKAVNYCLHNDRIGVSARHTFGTNAAPRYKQAYYVEGDHRTMGWLLGFMAEPAIARMTTDYRCNVIAAFVDPAVQSSGLVQDVEQILLDIVSEWVVKIKPDIPSEFHLEMQGLCEGCRDANPKTRVTINDLWELNAGTEAILAHLYTGQLFAKGVSKKALRVPMYCNAFMAPGDHNRRFFGRDFMFPTANVFQDAACLIVYHPDPEGTETRHGFVSQTAPGIIGSLAAVNGKGVAIGINMFALCLCDPHRPGFNGLLLNRYCMELADSAKAAVELVVGAQRGVSWLYPIADASGDAFIVEAGKRLGKKERFPYLDFIPRYYRRRLPGLRYIEDMQKKYGNPLPDRGAVVRAATYTYPTEYMKDWNEGLWSAFDRNVFHKLLDLLSDLGTIIVAIITGKFKNLFPLVRKMVRELVVGRPYSPDYFGERDFIDKTWTDTNCPGPFYFAPQRESRQDVLVATNNCISPEMRLVEMNALTAILAGSHYDDFQWRYDELNKEVLHALDVRPDGLDDDTAWSLINFLSPAGESPQFPGYYNPDGKNLQDVEVMGSVNLFDLTARKIKSLFGYYADDPVTITLPAYL